MIVCRTLEETARKGHGCTAITTSLKIWICLNLDLGKISASGHSPDNTTTAKARRSSTAPRIWKPQSIIQNLLGLLSKMCSWKTGTKLGLAWVSLGLHHCGVQAQALIGIVGQMQICPVWLHSSWRSDVLSHPSARTYPILIEAKANRKHVL